MLKKIASTCSVLSFLLASSPLLAQSPSQWVYYDANHHLQYQTDALGNKILDFSYAGYQGGGVALPNLPVRVTLQPSGGDDTASIQNASPYPPAPAHGQAHTSSSCWAAIEISIARPS